MTAKSVQERLAALADPARARILAGFFKTGPGEYGEGDRFRGIPVPMQRRVARDFHGLPLREIDRLLRSPWHEDRLTALLILTLRFPRAAETEQREIYSFYLRRARRVNNWDLVDLTAPCIVGGWLVGRSIGPLRRLARSRDLWERRIAMVATFAFIRRGEFGAAEEIAETLLRDPHDLIHKAAGWMLREVGKRDRATLERFLDRHAATMPRTMLRYAIEKFSPARRQRYLRVRRDRVG